MFEITFKLTQLLTLVNDSDLELKLSMKLTIYKQLLWQQF